MKNILNTGSTVRIPSPDAKALAHSQQVVEAVRASIRAEGPLSLADYMQFVLYGAGYGYYMSGSQKLGAAGDFITAPVVSSLFGQCLARQAKQVLGQTAGSILELGAGTGELVAALLLALLHEQQLPERYYILEPSADLALRQRGYLLASLPPDALRRIQWIDSLPENFVGLIIANEVIDAMPVEQFQITPALGVEQLYIDVVNDALCTVHLPASDALVHEVERLQSALAHPLHTGYRSEINMLLTPWLQALAQALEQGLVLLIDYGYPRKEFYLPEREQGTLRCYFRHHVHDDFLLYPGLQDITSDVDFTRVAQAGCEAGLDLHGFTSQTHFLLGTGLAEHAQAALSSAQSSAAEGYRIAQQVRTLSMPSEMGERFQFMGLSRNLDADLQGFMQADFSYRL